MVQTATRILKSSDVEIDGRLQIGLGQPLSTQGGDRRPASASPQVQIVEKQNDFAVIEFTCPCGQKTRIRCNFVEPGGKPNPQAQKDNVTPAARPK